MAWLYSDYLTFDDSTRLVRLRLHIAEVSNRITEDYSIGGRSKSVGALNTYLAQLKTEEARLGGQSPRAHGRSRVMRIDNLEPPGID